MAQPLKKYGPTPIIRERDTVTTVTSPVSLETPLRSGPEYQAYQALRLVFVAAPLIAGFDKYFGVLVNWDQYLAPVFPEFLGIAPHTFMLGVGAIEVIAGIGVAFKPRIFGYVVAAWMAGIILNLILLGDFYDIALRDFGLCVGAYALARLADRFDYPRVA